MLPYDPPAGTYPFFPSSVWTQRIPANPTVNSNTAAWLSKYGTLGFSKFQFAGTSSGISEDYTEPIYLMNAQSSSSLAVKVHCIADYGTCTVEGKTVYVDARDEPENTGVDSKDSHLALIDTVGGREYDFWRTQWPPKNGTLTIGWGGSCELDGSGYPGCAATATGTPLSVGLVRVSDLFYAMASPTGSLPYAVAVATKCSDGKVPPMTGSDGHTAGCAPEGSRLYLAMHDAEVDASNAPAIVKALYRTIDEDHYGMIVTDTDGGEDGFYLSVENDLTYSQLGQPGPLVNRLLPEINAEGWGGGMSGGVYHLNIPGGDVDLANKLKFL